MLHPVPKVATALVAICLKLDLNEFVISKLRPNKPCGCAELADGSELTAFALAAFDKLQHKIASEPLSNVSCPRMSYVDGKLVFTMIVKGTTSGVNKAIALAKCLNMPSALYAPYGAKMQLLGGKASREEFNWCCKEFYDALSKSKLHVFGKTQSIKADVVKSRLGDLHTKSTDIAKAVGKVSQPAKRTRSETSYPSFKADGVAAAALYHLVCSVLKLPASMGTGYVSVNVARPDRDSLDKKIKEAVPKYAAAVSKLTPESYTYMLVSMGLLDPCLVANPSEVAKLLK